MGPSSSDDTQDLQQTRVFIKTHIPNDSTLLCSRIASRLEACPCMHRWSVGLRVLNDSM